jgi:uncharacterized protein (DUF305 family)
VPAPRAEPGQRAAPRRLSEADVRFAQRMIGHHGQALEMTRLVPGRAARADVRLLAERIEISQRDEIALMRRWLESRGASAPAPDARHDHHAPSAGAGQTADGVSPMPGMLSRDEMDRLARAEGATFDRLFLELMIRHHEGAVRMVEELFATPGGGQEPEIFRLASDVAGGPTRRDPPHARDARRGAGRAATALTPARASHEPTPQPDP